jgi:hypothetical protein
MSDKHHAASLKPYICVLFLLILGALAFVEFRTTGRVRRTFVFYTAREQATVVEERMFPRIAGVDSNAAPEDAEERDIRRYVEEALLGPITPGLAPLFPQGTRLYALMYRDGVVYANLSEGAALSTEGGDVFQNIRTLSDGILRNFFWVQKVEIFIEGQKVF